CGHGSSSDFAGPCKSRVALDGLVHEELLQCVCASEAAEALARAGLGHAAKPNVRLDPWIEPNGGTHFEYLRLQYRSHCHRSIRYILRRYVNWGRGVCRHRLLSNRLRDGLGHSLRTTRAENHAA